MTIGMDGYVAALRALVGHRPLILVGANVIVEDPHGHVLLQRRSDSGTWGFPGGLMEPGETLEETARRELREETGLEAGDLECCGVVSGPECYFEYPNGDKVYNVSAVYIAKQVTGRMRQDGVEGSELRFFDGEHVPAEFFAPDLPILHHYLQHVR